MTGAWWSDAAASSGRRVEQATVSWLLGMGFWDGSDKILTANNPEEPSSENATSATREKPDSGSETHRFRSTEMSYRRGGGGEGNLRNGRWQTNLP